VQFWSTIIILVKLAEGDLRTTGASEEAAEEMRNNQALFDHVVSGLHSDDPGLRMRCADAIEKASTNHHGLLQPHKKDILGFIGNINQQEVQRHVAQIIPRLDMTEAETDLAMRLMQRYFTESKSNIVRTFALQTICDLAANRPGYTHLADEYLQKALHDPAHSLQSRARKLLGGLSK
jgi:hypothetical protein